jgi:hypothetical protein
VAGLAAGLHLHERTTVVVQARVFSLLYIQGAHTLLDDAAAADSAADDGADDAPRWIALEPDDEAADAASQGGSAAASVATPGVSRRTRSVLQSAAAAKPHAAAEAIPAASAVAAKGKGKSKAKGKGPAAKRRRRVPTEEQDGPWEVGVGLSSARTPQITAPDEGGATVAVAAAAAAAAPPITGNVLQSSRKHLQPVGPLGAAVCRDGMWVAGLSDINAELTMEVLLPPSPNWTFAAAHDPSHARTALVAQLSAKGAAKTAGSLAAEVSDHAAIVGAARALFSTPVVVRLDMYRVGWDEVEVVAVKFGDV